MNCIWFQGIGELKKGNQNRGRGREGERERDMWVFYLISFPLTLGMVVLTLNYFAGPDVPRYVLFTVGYTWFCSLSIIILVPADISSVNSLFPNLLIHIHMQLTSQFEFSIILFVTDYYWSWQWRYLFLLELLILEYFLAYLVASHPHLLYSLFSTNNINLFHTFIG